MNNEVKTAFHKKILKVYYAQNNLMFREVGKLNLHMPLPPNLQ